MADQATNLLCGAQESQEDYDHISFVSGNSDLNSIYKKGGFDKDIIDASARSLNIEKIARTIT